MRDLRRATHTVIALVVAATLALGCTSVTGKTAGRTIDDATITATVKADLAAEKAATLTRVDVDTNNGVVYLNGTVSSPTEKDRATQITRSVNGVRKVVNNLQVQTS